MSIGKTFTATTSICGSMSGINMVSIAQVKGFVCPCIDSSQQGRVSARWKHTATMNTTPNKRWWIISTRLWTYSREYLLIKYVLHDILTGITTNGALVPRRRRHCPVPYRDLHSRRDRRCLSKGPWKRRHCSMPRPFLE